MNTLDKATFAHWIITCRRNDETFDLYFNQRTYKLNLERMCVNSGTESFRIADFFRRESGSTRKLFGYNSKVPSECTFSKVLKSFSGNYCVVDGGWYDSNLEQLFLISAGGFRTFVVTTERKYFLPIELVPGKRISRSGYCEAYNTELIVAKFEVEGHTFERTEDGIRVTSGGESTIWDKNLYQQKPTWTLTLEQQGEVFSILFADITTEHQTGRVQNIKLPATNMLFQCLPTPDINVRDIYKQAGIPVPDEIEKILDEASGVVEKVKEKPAQEPSWTLTESQKSKIVRFFINSIRVISPTEVDNYLSVSQKESLFNCSPTPDLNIRNWYKEKNCKVPVTIEKIFDEAKVNAQSWILTESQKYEIWREFFDYFHYTHDEAFAKLKIDFLSQKELFSCYPPDIYIRSLCVQAGVAFPESIEKIFDEALLASK